MTVSAPEPTANGDKSSAEEHRPTPLLAMLGAGDAAVAAVARAFADAYAAAASRRETVQHRVHELPAEFESLRARFSGDDLRRALETYRAQIERAYAQFAGRGEETWDKLREKPQVRHAGEKVARAGQRLTGRAADVVVDASAAASDAVEDAGTATAQVIEEAGDDAAAATRKATGAKGAGTKATPRSATPKPAVRRPSSE